MNITINIDGYINSVLESLIKKGVVKTKSEALRLGILNLADKYVLEDLEDKAYRADTYYSFMKDWEKEPDGVWESYLDDNEK